MKKADFIERYGEDKYNEYLEKQKMLTKKWRENNKEKAREYGREYYYRLKKLAMMALAAMKAEDQDKNIL